jgi:hypothetical protein
LQKSFTSDSIVDVEGNVEVNTVTFCRAGLGDGASIQYCDHSDFVAAKISDSSSALPLSSSIVGRSLLRCLEMTDYSRELV